MSLRRCHCTEQHEQQPQGAGGEAVANYDNVATPEGGEKIVKTAVEFFGKLDILINNAGILRDKSFLKMDPENWNAVLAVGDRIRLLCYGYDPVRGIPLNFNFIDYKMPTILDMPDIEPVRVGMTAPLE